MNEPAARAIHQIERVQLLELKEGPDVSHHTEDGIYIKQLHFPEPGIFIGQHSHTYGHAFMVAAGELRLWIDGAEVGDFLEGACIHVGAGKKHTLMSLRHNTRGYCIHNLHGMPDVQIAEHAAFPG